MTGQGGRDKDKANDEDQGEENLKSFVPYLPGVSWDEVELCPELKDAPEALRYVSAQCCTLVHDTAFRHSQRLDQDLAGAVVNVFQYICHRGHCRCSVASSLHGCGPQASGLQHQYCQAPDNNSAILQTVMLAGTEQLCMQCLNDDMAFHAGGCEVASRLS